MYGIVQSGPQKSYNTINVKKVKNRVTKNQVVGDLIFLLNINDKNVHNFL